MWIRFVAVLVACLVPGCANRAAIRIPGAAGAFHPARIRYEAESTSPRAIRVALPTDARLAHYGENVAGTRWQGCETDPFWGDSAARTLHAELERELRDGKLFSEVLAADEPSALVLETEIRALCAQAIGFLWIRVAGITSLHFTLRDGDQVLFERTIEDVVTDADEEYSGSQAAFIEQAMKILISDSLHEVLYDLLRELDALEPTLTPAPHPL
jgi:hypothetical protein